jgi:hypothetical protein
MKRRSVPGRGPLLLHRGLETGFHSRLLRPKEASPPECYEVKSWHTRRCSMLLPQKQDFLCRARGRKKERGRGVSLRRDVSPHTVV